MAAVYPERESRTLEFKSAVPEFRNLIKTCIAFANGKGGRIVIGVDDETRTLLGVSDKDRERIYDEFPNSLYDNVSPSLIANIFEKRMNDESVLIIEIPPSPKKPYFLKGDGIPRGVYVRVGSSTRRATPDYLEDLTREGNRINFDEEIVRKDIDILSKELLVQFYGKQVSHARLIADAIITPSQANRDTYCPTVTGVLFFTEEPQFLLPEATVMCTRFSGDSGREIIQTEELTGPIGRLSELSFKLVASWLIRDYKLRGVQLKGVLPIPEEALREAILNALIHRKYSIPGAVKIAIYDNHLEVFSPGALPGLMDIENLGDGTTFLRNPHIARIAHRMGLVEKLGSGVRLIFDSCKKAGLKKPYYEEGSDSTKITFYFEPERSPQESDEEAILALAKRRGSFSLQDVMTLLSVSRNTATRKLSPLIRAKKLFRTGKGPSVRYLLQPSLDDMMN